MIDSRRIAIYPGSFDPITNGHLDLIQRGMRLFDKIIVAVGVNDTKKPMLNVETRVKLIHEVAASLTSRRSKVVVAQFSGLLGEFAKGRARFILRGLRTLNDFDYEFQMAFANQDLYPELETVFVATSQKYSAVSSSLVRTLMAHADQPLALKTLCRYVPPPVAQYLLDNLKAKQSSNEFAKLLREDRGAGR